MPSSTPSICAVVGFSCANHLRRVSSGASRSPSHKRTAGIMLPPFLYSLLRLLAPLLALLASFGLNLFSFSCLTRIPNLDPFTRLSPSCVFPDSPSSLPPFTDWCVFGLSRPCAISPEVRLRFRLSPVISGFFVFGASGATAALVAV